MLFFALRAFKAALQFLTRLPLPGGTGRPVPLYQAAPLFPLVGLVVSGLALAMLHGAGALGLGERLSAVVAIATMILITGALHEDGLADVVDGFGGGGERVRKLEIMHDPRKGSFGVLALVLMTLARIEALVVLPSDAQGALAIVGGAMLSRGIMPPAMAVLPPARSDGLGAAAGRPSRLSALMALVLGAAPLALLPLEVAALALVAAGGSGLALGWLAWRQIQGVTGDVLGALQQVTELSVLVAIAIALGPD